MDTDQTRQYKYIASLGSTTMSKFSQLKIFLHGLRGVNFSFMYFQLFRQELNVQKI